MNETTAATELGFAHDVERGGRLDPASTALTISGPERLRAMHSAADTTSAGGMGGWLHAFRRRWILALSLGLIGGVAAAALTWHTWQPEFTSVATLRIASRQPIMLGQLTVDEQQSPFDLYKRTQRELIYDHLVLNAALRDSAVAKLPLLHQQLEPAVWLAKEIVISFPGDAEILQISMHGPEPETITTLVNAVCDAYVDRVAHAERNDRLGRLESLEKIHGDAEEKVRQKRSELKTLTETLGTGDSRAATLKQQIALESYAALRKEQLAVQLQLMRAEAKQAVQKDRCEALEKLPLPSDELDSRIKSNPEYLAAADAVEKLRKLFHETELKLASGQEWRLEKNRADLTSAEQKLEQLHTQIQPSIEAQLRRELLLQAKLDLDSGASEVSTLVAENERLGQEVERLGGEANQIGRSTVDLEMMRSELDNLEAIRKQLASEIEASKIELSSEARIEILSRAEVPQYWDTKARLRGTMTSGAAGFLVPLVGICWWDLRRKRINSAHEVSGSLGLPIIGTMPLIPARAHRRLTGSTEPTVWNRLLTESVDSIREMLLSEGRSRTTKVVLVSSATQGEGKTTVATQLAKSFARTGHHTLLLDCDLRRPATQFVFSDSSGPGLSDVLGGATELGQAIYPTAVPNLYHLPVGGISPGSHELLCTARSVLSTIFRQLSEQFDIVVVDSSPILPVVDTLVVGQFADTAVLSVMRDVSQRQQVSEAQARLERVGVHVLGAVVTSKVTGQYRSAYQYGYALPREATPA